MLASTALIASCQLDQPTAALRAAPPASPSLSLGAGTASAHRRRLSEARFVRLAAEAPGFGGYYIDANHRLVAYVKRSSALSKSVAAIRSHFSADFSRLPQRARPVSYIVVDADYDFQTLSDYRDFVSDSLLGNLPGVTTVDLDEAINRVTIGVQHANAAATKAAVLARLVQHGIPAKAAHFNLSEGIDQPSTARLTRTSNTRAAFHPTNVQTYYPDTLAAGIAFRIVPNHGCTIGAIVDSGSVRMMLTASHCSSHMYEVDGDTAATLGNTFIGIEHSDPQGTYQCNFWGNECWLYRTSDALLYSIQGGNYNRRGVIARPTARQFYDTSTGILPTSYALNVDSIKPWLYVTDTAGASAITVGMDIDHIGLASGWTHGQVNETCIDGVQLSGEYTVGIKIKVYCDDGAYFFGRSGDSGGPVFIWDGADGAVLIGVISSLNYDYRHADVYIAPGDTDHLALATRFSNWSEIVFDLGPLAAAAQISIGSPSISATLSGGVPTISWSAISVTGSTGPTTYALYRSDWNAYAGSWVDLNAVPGSTTSTSFVDSGAPITLQSYSGGTQPDPCYYDYAVYVVVAYNSGYRAVSNTIYVQGNYNYSGSCGPGGSPILPNLEK